jgi:PAS domain S-box-containing protein
MTPETLAGLDPLPARVRRPVAPLPGPPPQMMRAVFAVSALACAAASLLFMAERLPAAVGAETLAFAVLALAAAACTRLPDARLAAALTAHLLLVTLTLTGSAAWLGWGLAAPGLPIVGLLVCVLCAAAGWRAGALLAAVAALALAGVALAVPARALPPGWPSATLLLGTHLLAIAAGLAGGAMISRVMVRYMRRAQERERRFRGLLALAADAYWEIDHDYRLVAAAENDEERRPLTPAGGLGAVPWELPRFGCDAETLDVLQADLDTRSPFRDLPVQWTGSSGRTRAFLASGEPRFDERGIFKGYWGVARDVTDVQATRAALAATETRYQELFSCIPTPLVLHRSGRIIDANPAAVVMFGYPDLQRMRGADLFAAYESGDSRERARRRTELLNEQPLGTALPVTDFRLRVRDHQVSVRATGVRVDAEGGPALLSIFVDDTERLAAEEAVRRSEAMLSHLVATSPDLITLTDMSSGRYAMVNHTFERVIGWSAAEAVGRTAQELGVWGSAQAREHFAALLQEQGSVTDLPVPFVTQGGATVSMLVSAARFVMDRRDYLVINARDVTERERERLEREAILAHASIGIAVTRDRRFVLTNHHFEQIYGWGAGELLGRPASVVWSGDEDYAEIGRLAGPLLARGEPVELERHARRKDGSTFLARVRGRAIDLARPAVGGTAWIVEDVTRQHQFEQTLARARDDAEAANRAKSAFLANTSHELRTPLNGIIGLAGLARAQGISDERRRHYLDQIADSAQALAGIISDILDLSKIEAGKLLIESTGFDLGALLRALAQTYTTLAAEQQLALHFEIDPAVEGTVTGDPLRVRQIVSNLLTNALKFTEQGHVHVRARRVATALGGRVRIEVRDTGLGLDEATRARLFKPFTQADQSTTRRYGGTGLGLSICRELATLLGGEVGVDSQLGVGSTFWAELPLPPGGDLAQPVPPAGNGGLHGARVLMVEDNPVNMMIAVAMLERWGVAVEQAEDGREAVAAVQQASADGRPFDAVLMDVQMPVMSGHEATRTLRALEVGRTLPIIALTAAALVSEREEALNCGMNDFLTKPVDADKLHATLVRWRRAPVAG